MRTSSVRTVVEECAHFFNLNDNKGGQRRKRARVKNKMSSLSKHDGVKLPRYPKRSIKVWIHY
ncbi:hypothetical protein CK203_056416 [Vitis vinifera]|uniref:Uncharacterized protein n=1 Tax=Vitis vinifera TaxID=29760 RepID=A0A438GPB4_VITVI|nr:hypothetical protein CK203_056416 [Vitis vinifera]